MARARRPSAQTTAVALALAERPAAWRYGYELCQQLGLKPGSLYPILVRLADRVRPGTGYRARRGPCHRARPGDGDSPIRSEGEPETAVAGRMRWPRNRVQ